MSEMLRNIGRQDITIKIAGSRNGLCFSALGTSDDFLEVVIGLQYS